VDLSEIYCEVGTVNWPLIHFSGQFCSGDAELLGAVPAGGYLNRRLDFSLILRPGIGD
jgi:hypothetical protein